MLGFQALRALVCRSTCGSPSMGICALCGMAATLRSSHYLPAAFFRRLHGEDSGKVLHPMSLNAKRAIYDCKQPQTKLLCDICNTVSRLKGRIGLQDAPAKKMGAFLCGIYFFKTRQLAGSAQPKKAGGRIFTLAIRYRGSATLKLCISPPAFFGGDGRLTGLALPSFPKWSCRLG